jgi:LPS export ABC transporter protein LptC
VRTYAIILFVMLLVLFSCENDLTKIDQVTYNPKSPDETIYDLRMVYSDSGYARVELIASYAETFHKPERITKLFDSIRVNFFSEKGEIISTLTSLYGENNYSKGLLTVKDSVRLYNHKKRQTLETEVLYWNQKDSSIFTPAQVIVKAPDGIFIGEGFKTKQDFSHYEILKPRGKIKIDKQQEIN